MLQRILTLPAGRRGKWVVVVFWLVVAVVASPVGSRLTTVVRNDQSSYLPGDAEATRVLDEVTRFPSGRTLPAVVVAERGGQATTAGDRAVLHTVALEIDGALGGDLRGEVAGPQPSRDGQALLLVVPLRGEGVRAAVDRMRSIIAAHATAGLSVKVGGIGGITADEIGSFSGIDSTLLLATLVIVVVILLVTYRSPILWIVPLLSVGVAFQLATAVVYELAAHAGLVVSGESQGILTVLVFGAGTDYALLLVARCREELTRHQDRHEAVATALRRVSPAVLASASTVVLGLLCLFAATLASDRGLAPVGAAGIVCTFAVLVTLLPALLSIFGRFLFWPQTPRAGATPDAMRSVWGRAGVRILRRPRLVWVSSLVVLLALGTGLLGFRGGLSNDQAFRTPPDSVLADRIVDAHFPAGVSNPADIVASAPAADAVVAAAQATPGVSSARVTEPPTGGLVRIAATLAAVTAPRRPSTPSTPCAPAFMPSLAPTRGSAASRRSSSTWRTRRCATARSSCR